jgi:hypothetical protein
MPVMPFCIIHSGALRLAVPAAVLAVLAASFAGPASAQTEPATVAPPVSSPPSPSRWSLSWGWNRETYSTSDIHFWGKDHDFTLTGVHAHDKQAPADIGNIFQTYLNPGKITIPQTNTRLAYQWHDDDALALNLDHMKYVMTTNQTVPIAGTIYGQTQSGDKVLSPDFMSYEHTDGLNILSLEYEKQWMVNPLGGAYPVRLFGLGGAGIAVPKSNVTLAVMGQKRNDQFHLAGGSAHLGLGAEWDFLGSYFVRFTGKAGYVDLPDVATSARHDHASQHFTYTEYMLTFGYRL